MIIRKSLKISALSWGNPFYIHPRFGHHRDPGRERRRTGRVFRLSSYPKMDNLLVSEFDGYSIDVLATKELSKLGAVINIVNETYRKSHTIENIIKDNLKDEKHIVY